MTLSNAGLFSRVVSAAARALAIGVTGAFAVLGAYQSDPSEAHGLGGALETLQRQPSGSYMLAAVAAGLLVHGAFMLLVARYRRIDPISVVEAVHRSRSSVRCFA